MSVRERELIRGRGGKGASGRVPRGRGQGVNRASSGEVSYQEATGRGRGRGQGRGPGRGQGSGQVRGQGQGRRRGATPS